MQLGSIDTAAADIVTPKYEAGVCVGTTIMTLEGETPVEHLTPGDRIITRDSGMAVLKEITKRTVKMQAIRIKAGSLGHTRPDRDMIISPGANIHIRDWRAEAIYGAPTAQVPAHKLVDGEFLSFEDAREVAVYELTFERQHIIYADGIELIAG